MADSSDNSNSVYAVLSRALPFFAPTLAFVYSLGFVIVASHLAKYGASPLELFRLQYLAAGLWFCLIVVGLYGLVILLDLAACNIGLPIKFSRAIAWVSFLVASGGFSYFVPIPPFTGLRHLFPVAIMLCLSDLSLRAGISLLVRTLKRQNKEESSEAKNKAFKNNFITIYLLTAGVICLGGSIAIYSESIYRRIPFSLGGGQPRQAIFRLLANSTSSDSFLDRDGKTQYSVPYEILTESENLIVVISPKNNQRAIEFDRKAVEAVIICGNRP